MNRSVHVDRLVRALAQFQSEANPIKTNHTNPRFKKPYATHDDMVTQSRDGMAENNLAITHSVMRREDKSYYLESTLWHADTPIDTVVPQEVQWISTEIPLIIESNDMQKFGAARTYAKRYNHVDLLGLCESDNDLDDDGNSISGPNAPKSTAVVSASGYGANAMQQLRSKGKPVQTNESPPVQVVPRTFAQLCQVVDFRTPTKWKKSDPIITADDWKDYTECIDDDFEIITDSVKAGTFKPLEGVRAAKAYCDAVSARHPMLSAELYNDLPAAITAWDNLAACVARECKRYNVEPPIETKREGVASA